MKYLFSSAGLEKLEAFSKSNSLLAFDFDGTLTRHKAPPAVPEVKATTQMLWHQIAPLAYTAVISGRSLDDLKKLVPFEPGFLVGNHGLESPSTESHLIQEAKHSTAQWLSQIKTGIQSCQGVFLEEKTYSLSIHYQKAKNKKQVRELLLNISEALNPTPRVMLGKNLINLIPSSSPHKGKALLALMKKTQTDSAIYVGDDLTDEDVFEMAHPKVLGIRIGKIRKTKAPFYLKTQSEINRLLSHILFFLQKL